MADFYCDTCGSPLAYVDEPQHDPMWVLYNRYYYCDEPKCDVYQNRIEEASLRWHALMESQGWTAERDDDGNVTAYVHENGARIEGETLAAWQEKRVGTPAPF